MHIAETKITKKWFVIVIIEIPEYQLNAKLCGDHETIDIIGFIFAEKSCLGNIFHFENLFLDW